jgi:hypothetical protein
MSKQAVFILISDRSGWYAFLTAAALDCLRYTEPDAHITLVCDTATEEIARVHYKHVLDRADSLVVVDTAESGAAASRELKMRLREIISGPFIYIDSDAFVIDELPTPAPRGAEFSIAIDAGVDLLKLKRTHNRLGWKIPATYYNAGVFCAEDTPGVHKLFADWQRYWKEFRSLGSFSDQPALNRAISLGSTKITTLDSRYNAVFHSDPKLAKNAAILHFFASEKSLFHQTILGDLIEEVAMKGGLTDNTIQRLRRSRYPWKDPYSFKGNLYTGRLLRAAAFAPLCMWRRVFKQQSQSVHSFDVYAEATAARQLRAAKEMPVPGETEGELSCSVEKPELNCGDQHDVVA